MFIDLGQSLLLTGDGKKFRLLTVHEGYVNLVNGGVAKNTTFVVFDAGAAKMDAML
jgi:hypothetical protein